MDGQFSPQRGLLATQSGLTPRPCRRLSRFYDQNMTKQGQPKVALIRALPVKMVLRLLSFCSKKDTSLGRIQADSHFATYQSGAVVAIKVSAKQKDLGNTRHRAQCQTSARGEFEIMGPSITSARMILY